MIELKDIYLAVKTLLFEQYGYKIYGNEVIEGFKVPSFFIAIYPIVNSSISLNFKEKAYSIKITYFASEKSQVDELQKIDEIEKMFGYKLSVKDRKLNITDFTYEYVGNASDKLQLTVEIEYLDAPDRQQKQYDIAKDLRLEIEKR